MLVVVVFDFGDFGAHEDGEVVFALLQVGEVLELELSG